MGSFLEVNNGPFSFPKFVTFVNKEVTGGGRREYKEDSMEMEDLDGKCFLNTIFAVICNSDGLNIILANI